VHIANLTLKMYELSDLGLTVTPETVWDAARTARKRNRK
jgi:hypothetical protein